MRIKFVLFLVAIFIGSIFNSCVQNKENKVHDESNVLTESIESHVRDYEGGEGEEEGSLYDIDHKYEKERNGVRLILSYDNDISKFTGSIENITNNTLAKVRVEIHLSNGKELGPTTPTDLKAGETREIELDAKGEIFDKWNTHPEVGVSEHSHENSEEGEHSEDSEQSGEKRGEHVGEHR